MAGYVARRVGLAALVLLGVTLVTFSLLQVIPGDAASLAAGRSASGEQIAAVRARIGLDQPLPVQYLVYLSNLIRGDLGSSPFTHRPVLSDILDVLPSSIELVMTAMLINICVAVPLGVLAAVREGKRTDVLARLLVIGSAALPVFWLALMLQLIVSARLGLLPLTGQVHLDTDIGARITGLATVDSLIQGRWSGFVEAVRHLVLPALTLAVAFIAVITRTTRSTMLGALRQDYIVLARAKGLSERRIVVRHALRNALIPTVTILALQLGWMMGAVVLVEGIFARRGIGSYAVTAIQQKDLWAVVGVVLVVSAIFVVANLVVDMLYGRLDPKLRHGAS